MEIISLLTAAKELGFEIGHILSLIMMYLMLRRDLMKVFDKQFGKLIDAIKTLEKAHNKRLTEIETHVGMNKHKEMKHV